MHMRAKILLDFQEVSQILLPESDLIETRLIPLRPSILRPVCTRSLSGCMEVHALRICMHNDWIQIRSCIADDGEAPLGRSSAVFPARAGKGWSCSSHPRHATLCESLARATTERPLSVIHSFEIMKVTTYCPLLSPILYPGYYPCV